MFNKSDLYDDNNLLYEAMLKDIAEAKSSIYLETYRIKEDSVGLKFKEALEAKCKQGVKVKILVDSWGIAVSPTYFSNIIKLGGQVRYFKKFKFVIDIFTKNHRRNHRKLLLIDENITYIGSSNYTSYSLVWRELVLRIDGEITHYFKKIFRESFQIYKKYNFKKFAHKKIIRLGDFKIIQDIPTIYFQRIRKEFTNLINNAKTEILIETPYFLPGFKLRKALIDAANRGVDVKIMVPKHSDVKIADVLRNKYLGTFYKNNVKILFFTPNNLHAKCMLIDKEIFVVTSANFDYRSFRYQYEIALIGNHEETNKAIREHIFKTMEFCEEFDFQKWQSLSVIEKVVEWIILPLRYFL